MAKETQQQQMGSFDPETFTGGGFLDDVDVEIIDAEVVTYDFEQKAAMACCLAVTFKQDGYDEPGRPQYYKIGPVDKFAPSADGSGFVTLGTTTGMNRQAKAALFMAALKNVGFDMTKLAKGVKGLIGVRGHLNTITLPPFKLPDGTTKSDDKVTVFSKLGEDAPAKPAGGKKAAPAAAKAKAAPAAAAAPQADDAVSEAAEAAILNKVAEGPVAKSSLASLLFNVIKDPALRNPAVKLANNEAWLSDDARPWKYDQGELTL